MPPKRKDAITKPSNAKPPTLINGLTKEELSKEQMEEHIARLREELDREREERNYFQLERDKIHTFREITERKLEEVRAKLKNLERAVEEDDGHHRVENKVYKQKMKHLLCEHQNTTSELKADRLAAAEVLQEEQEVLEEELYEKMRAIMVNMQALRSEDRVRELELKHEEEMAATRDNLEKVLAETTARYEEKLQLLRRELETLKQNESSERELHWNGHMAALTEDHNELFRDAKAVVSNVMQDAKATDKFTEEIAERKMKLRKMSQDKKSVLQENLRLTELIAEVRMENAYVERKTKFLSENDIKIPKRKVLETLKTDHEVLEARFSELQLERDGLLESFGQNMQRMREEADLPNSLLERKLQSLVESLEQIQARLQAVLSAPNMDHTALTGIADKVEEKIESRNLTIRSLEHQRDLISKARKDLLLTIVTKQTALTIRSPEDHESGT
ncbi:dynein regulatory complex subunit 4 [Kryptolebias marmoratus]|uniref:Dynein regulatory complex subunit 4 n=1 Tax=Kryptolebias marmoratus TaxID=37003 RepID=A0A3Q3A8L1_KRYMA|nr:dynein regulatory complex subunit 4 [Kryptolebias marmoratus]